jgi:hypothetical protein
LTTERNIDRKHCSVPCGAKLENFSVASLGLDSFEAVIGKHSARSIAGDRGCGAIRSKSTFLLAKLSFLPLEERLWPIQIGSLSFEIQVLPL